MCFIPPHMITHILCDDTRPFTTQLHVYYDIM